MHRTIFNGTCCRIYRAKMKFLEMKLAYVAKIQYYSGTIPIVEIIP